MQPPPDDMPPVRLSVIAPAHDEEANVTPLVSELEAALHDLPGGFEAIIVDDGSNDDTRRRLLEEASSRGWLRVLAMEDTPPGRGNGQSAAFKAGIGASRGALIALLDADLQNDPADLPGMVRLLDERGADFVQGDRSANRRDTVVRRASSWVGRFFRKLILADTIRDTGCSLRVMKREIAESLPLEFRGMHRFIPVTARQLGYTVIETPVRHRPRVAGEAKYGVWNRAIPGLVDCFAVRWMRARRRPTGASEPGTGPD
ncbi:MAG: glycosyltransferase [Planctomycetota bacterium]|nr:glycosyltransferase [Planctomycetota bacterium]MEC9157138.1 glycosyltransferase [Planctomycetota bacterium]MEC9233272.1 glycosyltransferase [Planctomycetota bacterium]